MRRADRLLRDHHGLGLGRLTLGLGPLTSAADLGPGPLTSAPGR